MNLIETQNRLDTIYHNVLKREVLRNKFDGIASIVSAPLLINLEQDYVDAEKRILFVGKETNKWWGKLQHFIDFDDSISILKQRYRAEFLGGVVISSESKDLSRSYKGSDWGNNAFWNKYKDMKIQLAEINYSVLWTELLKMDSGAQGFSKNSNRISPVVEISKDIFKNEIEILKPDYIIFVTATSKNTKQYDDIIKDIFKGYRTIEPVEKDQFWKFQYNDIICYRTLHPLSFQLKRNKSINWYQKIIDDIKRNN